MIAQALEMIHAHTGLSLTLCDYFPGIREYNGRPYFNVLLSERNSESGEYTRLQRFAQQYNLIQVEPNGVSRVAVFLNGHV